MKALNTIKILDVDITNDSKEKILEFIITRLKKNQEKTKIFTPNPEILVYASHHPSFKKLLNEANVSIPDGIGVVWASQLEGNRLRGRIAGVNFMQELCERCAKEAVSIGLLGGKGNVAEKAAECLMKRYPGLEVRFVGEEWSLDRFRRGPAALLSHPTASPSTSLRVQALDGSPSPRVTPQYKDTIGVLFVAFGFPKQEEWIAAHIDRLPVQAMMSVGGAFDFISGNVRRAPLWVQKTGFEWLYRLIIQPWRWKRQLKLVEFIWLVFTDRLRFH